jgi:hypothetical protein
MQQRGYTVRPPGQSGRRFTQHTGQAGDCLTPQHPGRRGGSGDQCRTPPVIRTGGNMKDNLMSEQRKM